MITSNIEVFLWLFPMIFIFHDFEEIIFMQAWIHKNKGYLCDRFPTLSKKVIPHFEGITTSSFALGVAEEFILISTITIISLMTKWYNLWIGAFVAFTLHLIIHCFQALVIRKYVPAVATSIICLPICLHIIKEVAQIIALNTIVMFSILSFIIMVVNLIIVHKWMSAFDKWLSKYVRHS